MAKQSYPNIKVPAGAKKSLAELFTDNGLTVPAGEVSLEIQNLDGNYTVFVSFGDQTGLDNSSGSPIPPMWARTETEDFTNVYIVGADSYIGILVDL